LKPKQQQNCENCYRSDPTNLELSYIFNTTPQRKACGHRERESACTLTLLHSGHRTCIPGGHVLIERRCVIKHCKKREGCSKEKKDQTHHTNNNNKVPFQTTNEKKDQHVWDLWRGEPRVVVYIQQHITTEDAVATEGEREREYTY